MTLGISIIIPVYNREKFLCECIDSVLAQNLSRNFEIIIVDDGSTDGSLEIAAKYTFPVVVLEKPFGCMDQGASATRNRGLLAAQYDYVCFLDSDDYLLPGALNHMADTLDMNPDLGYVFCRTKKLSFDSFHNPKISEWTRARMSKLDQFYHALFRGYCIHTNSIMFRRIVFQQVGGFNPKISNGEDGDMWIRVSEKYSGKFLDYFASVYRVEHGEGQLVQNKDEIKFKFSELIFLSALARCTETKHPDNMRLLLIKRILHYQKLQKLGKKINPIHHLYVSMKLFIEFPVYIFRFYFLYIS